MDVLLALPVKLAQHCVEHPSLAGAGHLVELRAPAEPHHLAVHSEAVEEGPETGTPVDFG